MRCLSIVPPWDCWECWRCVKYRKPYTLPDNTWSWDLEDTQPMGPKK